MHFTLLISLRGNFGHGIIEFGHGKVMTFFNQGLYEAWAHAWSSRLWLSGKVDVLTAGDSGIELGFLVSSHTSYTKIGTLSASLPGTWCYRVSAGNGWPSFNII